MISTIRFTCFSTALAILLGTSAATAAPVVIDFQTEDDMTTPLVNGQSVSSPVNFGTLFSLTSTGSDHDGLAIFDSTPEVNHSDQDLQVRLKNILIFQQKDSDQVGNIFDDPNDEDDGGSIIFDFGQFEPVYMLSLDLIDIDDDGAAKVILTDVEEFTRTYVVPDNWTKDINDNGPDGYDTLDLTTLAGQLGEGGSTATASQTAGFDPFSVIRMEVVFSGSAGLDNLRFDNDDPFEANVPEPSTAVLLIAGLLALLPRLIRRTRERTPVGS